MALLQRFVTACSSAPARAEIIDGIERVHHGELLRRAAGLGLMLRQHDKSPEGHVGIFLPNIGAFPASLFGAMLGAKVPVPINILLQPKEVAFILQDAGIHTVLTISQFKPLFDQLGEHLPWEVNAICLDQLPEAPAGVSPPPVSELIGHEAPDELACLIYTSGTTGNPKGVMLTYGNLEANADGSLKVLEYREHEDVVLAQLPLFHSFGLMATLICPLLDQVPLIMLARFNPTQLLRALEEHRVTAVCLVAPMYGLLCRHPKIRETDLSALRICVSGGGPLPSVIEQGWKALTSLDVLNGYGLTEASPVVANNAPWALRVGSIGKPLHNVEVIIRDPDGNPLPTGSEGEICVKAASVMKGYLNRPEDTAAAISDEGLLRTGDLGYLDEDGFLFITGRAKELIITAGENIMPLEIENALQSHPAVMEVAVIGMPDDKKGEVPVAAIVRSPEAEVTADELRAFLRGKIADFKIPRDFHFLEELPKNTLNKVLKKQLHEILEAE
jgi:long-chain acyl-CoA synthetase